MGTRQRFPLYALSFVRITGYGCPHQAHECRTLCAQMPCLPNDFAKQSIVSYIPGGRTYKRWASPVCKCALPTSEDLYLDSEKGMMVLSSGRCAPCSLASSIEDSTSRPSELRKRTLVLVLGQVVLTEPCGSVSVIRWIIATLRILLVASLPEMRTAHALACPLMGYVCRFVAMCS